ncbi:3'-5' exonuclease [Methylorubrum extorquens]
MERDFSPAELPYVETSDFEGANRRRPKIDAYFSADVETDGPIPGPYSLLSFAIVYAGRSDGMTFERPKNYENSFYTEIKPISHKFQEEALAVNKIDRQRLIIEGIDPVEAMSEACKWVKATAGNAEPVLVAYPLSFDWTWLYWYFVNYSRDGSPFGHSKCFDIKTAVAVKARLPISSASRSKLPSHLTSKRIHTHHALDDAKEQAEIFANIYEWGGNFGRD